MGFFGNIRNRVGHLVHVIGADIRGGEQWVARHTIQPVGHALGSAGQMIAKDARWIGREVRQVGRTIGHDASVVAHGVQSGFQSVEHVVEGVGQVVGSAKDAAVSVFGGVGATAHLLPVVLWGGGIVFVATKLGMLRGGSNPMSL